MTTLSSQNNITALLPFLQKFSLHHFGDCLSLAGCSSLWKLQSSIDSLREELYKPFSLLPLTSKCFPLQTLETDLAASMKSALPLLTPPSDLHQYGNKHKNLELMFYFVKMFNLPYLNIPHPQGISSNTILSFLQKKAPKALEEWNRLKRWIKEHPIDPSLDDPFPKKALILIEQEIEKAFSGPNAFVNLNLSSDMKKWLLSKKQGRDFLMVRSTGAEDSKQMANAGGNTSRAYVSSDPKILVPAIGDVVKSYFSKASLQNRLALKQNPFEEELSLAVAVQELIGEPIGGSLDPKKIPISFVLFTNEPIFIGDEKFRVTRLSASFGHGESVVSSNGVMTDSVYLLRSESHPDQLYILYNNREKTERLAPIRENGHVVLKKIGNPKELQKAHALNTPQLLNLYEYGVLMESFFDCPQDIEGVILGDTIHFVQARPVNRKPSLPTYLDLDESGGLETLVSEQLVTGKSSVIKIENRNEVLLANTLEEAERAFQGEKLVLVNQPAPDNSHSVVNFTERQVPCLYVSDWESLQNLLSRIDETHSLAVCMQSEAIHLWDQTKVNLEEHIVEGFAVHPAKIAILLELQDGLVGAQEKLKSLEPILRKIRQGSPEALEELQNHPEMISLQEMIAPSQGLLPKAIQSRVQVLQKMHEGISSAIQNMKAVLKFHPEDRLRRLFQAKTLETFIQGSNSQTTLSSYALKDSSAIQRSIEILKEYKSHLPFPPHCIDLLLNGDLSEESFASWKKFLLELEPLIEDGTISKPKFLQFQSQMASLRETGALPFWMMFFQPSGGSAIDRFESILNAISANDQLLIDRVMNLQKSIEKLNHSIERFGKEESFEEALQEYLALPELTPQEVKAASPMVQMMVYRVLERKITLLDTAAKTLKVNSALALENHRFKSLLEPYYTLMTTLAEKWVPAGLIPMNESSNLSGYIHRIRAILNDLPDTNPDHLRPSREFSVSAAMLGSGTAFERHRPQTLEDMLTLLHQNSLASLNLLNQELVSSDRIQYSLLPKALKTAISQIEQENWGRSVQRIGIDINGREAILRYNIPLDNHSGHLAIHYDFGSNKMILEGQLLGEARERWGATASFISDLEIAGEYVAKKALSQTEQELIFHWEVTPEKLPQALKDYAQMAEYSLDGNADRFDVFDRLSNQPIVLEELARKYFSKIVPSKLPFYRKYIDRGENLDWAAELIEANIGNNDLETQKTVLTIARLLMDKAQICETAIAAAKAYFGSEYWEVRASALATFASLLERGRDFEVTIDTAKTNIGDEYWAARENALKLFRALFYYNRGFEAAIDAAKTNARSGYLGVRETALELFKELVQKTQGIEAAIDAAKANFGSADLAVRWHALEILKELIQLNQGFEVAIDAAKANFGNEDRAVRETALELFEALVERNLGFEAAIEAAKTNIESKDWHVRANALVLFKMLFEKNLGFEAAIEAAKAHAENEDSMVRQSALELFQTLVRKDVGYEAAIDAAKANFGNVDLQVGGSALRLFLALVVKGQGFEAVIDAAKANFGSKDWYVRSNALLLFYNLIERGQGIEAAIDAATVNVRSSNEDVSSNARDLLDALRKKGFV